MGSFIGIFPYGLPSVLFFVDIDKFREVSVTALVQTLSVWPLPHHSIIYQPELCPFSSQTEITNIYKEHMTWPKICV